MAKRRPRRVKPRSAPSAKTIVLGLSPRAANLLRVILARSRNEEPELQAVQKELEDQLGVTDAGWKSRKEKENLP